MLSRVKIRAIYTKQKKNPNRTQQTGNGKNSIGENMSVLQNEL